jgi:phage virion morphogenesis protein
MSVKVSGGQQVQLKLSNIARGIKNPKKVLKRIGVTLLKEIDKNFRQEGNDGTAWASLQFRDGRILRKTGNLAGSFVFELVGNTAVKVGSPVEYSDIHQFGTDNIPARPMLPSERIAIATTKRLVNNYIKELSRV